MRAPRLQALQERAEARRRRSPGPQPSALSRHLWPPLVLLALTLVMTWPLATRLAVTPPGWGDALLHAWILAWNAHALGQAPTTVWQAPIFYPYPDTLAYTDHHLVLALLVAPLIWLTDNPILAYNLLLVLSFVLTGWAVYQLTLDLTAQPWAALIAGAAVTFGAYRMAHLLHLQLLQTAWLVWALVCLRRALRPTGADRLPAALLFGLFAGLQGATGLYYAFFAAAVLGGYLLLWAVEAGWRRLRLGRPLPWAAAGGVALGGIVAAAIVLPLTWPYLGVYATLEIVRSARELDNWSAPLRAYLAVPAPSLVYRALRLPLTEAGEFVLFPGLLATGLGLVTLAWWRGREALTWGLILLGGLVLSFGIVLRLERGGPVWPVPLPYGLLYEHLPGFGALRVPARWGMLVGLAVAVLAAVTLGRLLGRLASARRAAVGGLLLVGVLLETTSAPLALPDPAPLASVPPVYAWLGRPEQDDIGVVLELPVGRLPRGPEIDRILWRQYHGRAHWKALPVAYSGLTPFGTTDLLARVQRLPEAETLRYLQLLGVDTLVIHRDEVAPETLARLRAGLDASPLVRLRAEVGAASVYRLLPSAELAEGADDLGPGAEVYISADERVPGLLALALTRRWQRRGVTLYGPARPRYYGALARPRPGQVFAYGLLAADEEPTRHGFSGADRRWRSNGLAFYQGNPRRRVNLDLGQPAAGAFHPHYPTVLDILFQPAGLRTGATSVTWDRPLDEAVLEVEVASLTAGTLLVGDEARPVMPGVTIVTTPIQPERPVRLVGPPASALQRLRVGAPPDAPPTPTISVGAAGEATASITGSRLTVVTRAGGAGGVMLDIWGADAFDDRPIHLARGVQAVPAAGEPLTFSLDLLAPAAPWLSQAGAPTDGRYIAYLKDAARPNAPGQPIATFSIRQGALVAPNPVPLPLTSWR